jgi:hypothetical protein
VYENGFGVSNGNMEQTTSVQIMFWLCSRLSTGEGGQMFHLVFNSNAIFIGLNLLFLSVYTPQTSATLP